MDGQIKVITGGNPSYADLEKNYYEALHIMALNANHMKRVDLTFKQIYWNATPEDKEILDSYLSLNKLVYSQGRIRSKK